MKSTWEGIMASIFLLILVVFAVQVGRGNGAKIDPKRHRKNDAKKERTKMEKMSQQEAATILDTRGPGCRGGPSLLRVGKPLPFQDVVLNSPRHIISLHLT